MSAVAVKSLLLDISTSNAKLDQLSNKALSHDLTEQEDAAWALADAKADAARRALKRIVMEQFELDREALELFSEAIS